MCDAVADDRVPLGHEDGVAEVEEESAEVIGRVSDLVGLAIFELTHDASGREAIEREALKDAQVESLGIDFEIVNPIQPKLVDNLGERPDFNSRALGVGVAEGDQRCDAGGFLAGEELDIFLRFVAHSTGQQREVWIVGDLFECGVFLFVGFEADDFPAHIEEGLCGAAEVGSDVDHDARSLIHTKEGFGNGTFIEVVVRVRCLGCGGGNRRAAVGLVDLGIAEEFGEHCTQSHVKLLHREVSHRGYVGPKPTSKPRAAIVVAMGTNCQDGPVLSIVMPVLNAAEFLPRAIESVRRVHSLGCRVELILADGGSTDGSLEIARSAASAAGSDWIRLIEGPDSGQADAINTGFATAQGRFLGWLNADDRYRPTGLASMAEVLERSQSDVVVGRCVFVDGAGRVVHRPVPPDPVTPASFLKLLSGWYAGRSMAQPEVFVARRTFERMGGLDTSLYYTMDHEYWLRLAVSGCVFEHVDCLVAEQLVHAGQKTADNAAVVGEQLGYCRDYVQRLGSELGEDREAIERELGLLGRKLGIARRLLAGLRNDVCQEQSKPNASADDEIVWRLARSVGRVRSLACVGMDENEIRRVRERLNPARPPVVVSARLGVESVFDAVVLRSDGFPHERMVVSGLLRPGGIAAILGEQDLTQCDVVLNRVRRCVCDRITFNTPTVLPGDLDLVLLARLRSRGRMRRDESGQDGLEVVHGVGYGNLIDHQIFGLFQGLIARPNTGLWRSVLVRKPAVSGR